MCGTSAPRELQRRPRLRRSVADLKMTFVTKFGTDRKTRNLPRSSLRLCMSVGSEVFRAATPKLAAFFRAVAPLLSWCNWRTLPRAYGQPVTASGISRRKSQLDRQTAVTRLSKAYRECRKSAKGNWTLRRWWTQRQFPRSLCSQHFYLCLSFFMLYAPQEAAPPAPRGGGWCSV